MTITRTFGWEEVAKLHESSVRRSSDGARIPNHVIAGLVDAFLEREFGREALQGSRLNLRHTRSVRVGESITIGSQCIASTAQTTTGLDMRDYDIDVLDERRQSIAAGCVRMTTQRDRAQSGPGVHTRQRTATASGALAGCRVLELSHAWAGPYCGMMLADMGADVIKIERPRQPEESRGGYPYVAGRSIPFLILHRNKRSVSLDLKSDRGRELFLRMATEADVIIQNFRPGVTQRLGLDYESLKAVNPRLVYASLSGFGLTGPAAHEAGVNLIAQSVSGVASTTSIEGREPITVLGPLLDVVAGMLCATGTVAAYSRALRTGLGQQVDTSLIEAGLALMHSTMCLEYFSDREEGFPGSSEMNGPSSIFKGSDGEHFSVFASFPSLWERFVKVAKLKDIESNTLFASRELRTRNAAALHAALGEAFLSQPAAHWVKLFKDAGVPTARVLRVGEALRHPQTSAREMFLTERHDAVGVIPTIGIPIKFSETPGQFRLTAPGVGQHTWEVLREFGLDDGSLGELEQQGVI